MPNPQSPLRCAARWCALLTLIFTLALALSPASFAQTTVATGSIVGTVTDPTGAAVEGAKVTITNVGTNQVIALSTNATGSYNSGALTPGSYKVQISAKGFSSSSQVVTVQVGNTATANASLQVGQESTVVEVQGSALSVNTEQSEVQGVLTSSQIENLPVNGRNFLDLAQLEPGVQIQDGQNFDPTKAGYSSISFGGRFGRTARVNVDGVDVSDETVGTVTQDIPASGIDQFQLGQSSLDLSNDLTSSGAVNVTTKSGTNAYHGQAFGLFRDRTVGGVATPGGGDLPFQRSQYGGNFGGALIKDKLFFFADGERIKQDSFAPVQVASPFDTFNGGFQVPFREDELMGRLDYNLGHNARLFYRYNYYKNSLNSDFGLGYGVYVNKNIARTHVAGVDFNTGTFTHTVRFSYLKFQNQIADIVKGSDIPGADIGIDVSSPGTGLFLGPSPLAPQSTPQRNFQIKYDGSKQIHSHILRFGISYNDIQGGGFANFYGTAPRIYFNTTDDTILSAASGPFPDGSSNPLNYPVNNVRLGNGLGFNTLEPALGFPAGGLGPDHRLGLYFGDSWKIRRNFTLSAGLRYDRDTGRTDSDLPAIPEINDAFPGWGNPVKQANTNFAPQLGFAWDPSSNGKTVIRGGVGLYYENVIFNNVLFDRPFRLQTGAFNQTPFACLSGVPQPIAVSTNFDPSGFITPDSSVCSGFVGDAVGPLLSFWQQVLSGNPLDLQAANPNYIGNFLDAGIGVPGPALFAPNYKSPRSVQINFGVQREIRHGMIFSADYLRNIETRTLLGVDINHTGDISHFNLGAAQAAIAATLADCNQPSIDLAASQGTCPDANGTHHATMVDFANHGLTSDADFGQACVDAIGVNCAFPGSNPAQGPAFFLQPIGRSVYNALQMKLVQNVQTPFRGVKAMNFQVAYSLSRFENTGGAQLTGTTADNDQDFVLAAADNNQPGRYFGPSILDRTHQISFGGFADLPMKFRLGLIGHFYSPLSTGITIPNFGEGSGEIFRSDFTGDGTTQDPMPGTHFGQFDRGTNASGLNSLISTYNTNVAGQPTPAGNVLVQNGLMSAAQLASLGGVAPTVDAPVPGQVNFTWMKSFDLNLGWRYTIKDRVSIEPSIAVFNLFNFGNFNLPPNTMNGILFGAPGTINGTDRVANEQFRVGNGTGVYAVGAGRQIEWGLKVSF